ncbi:hypothetical protein [Candidatus Albibeggiatoa sp. nov. BB20]|uniref:hypothetical protein n=1 Tax=Candidatus Albibeggiatoa sp. nov. BB20 TaxID=3162723 RepID=UPI0033658A13
MVKQLTCDMNIQTVQHDEQDISKQSRKSWMRWLGWSAGCVSLAFSTTVLATSCPSGGVDTEDGTVTAVFAIPNDGDDNIACGSTQVGGVFVTTDQQINTNSSVMLALPDTEPSGASNPARTYMFLPTGSTPIPHTITCAEATITTTSNVNSISLPEGASCSLTMQGNSGTNGGEVIYTATLSRTGEIYSLSDGEICGAPYVACSAEVPADGAFEKGKQACIDNPADCNLFTQADLDALIGACVANPSSCGIQTGASNNNGVDEQKPYFDIETSSLHIPALSISGEIYQATLRLGSSPIGDISFDLLSLSKDNQPIITHSSLAD